ncbi:hypothetical protein [Sporolactobacillus terrae]|uniref:Uncharacterized protein n=1 Tax=Sporolactobacillus terrae TaxID=269673 RepID=A0A5K7WV20_9BACL|nr:hypothetical protein [Sporolactobacillus terrae]BBN97474.1 hypothetical protein St703_01790 [Sporolactobacillus terrae]
MNKAESYFIDGYQLKNSAWVTNDKSLIINADPDKDFEYRSIIISKEEIRSLYQAILDEEEESTDAEDD